MCLAFVVPMLLAYEIGIVVLGPQAMRNGADVWLRQLLAASGFGQYFLLPILTCGILLGWQHACRQPWQVSSQVLGGMLLESFLLGWLLIAFARWQQAAGHEWVARASVASNAARDLVGVRGELVAYLGAGIYEELLFRLMLLPCAIGLGRWAGLQTVPRTLTAILVTSLAFSAAHYDFVTPGGQPFDFSSFSFRFVAGVMFGGLFLYRGFGVAAGTHATYDILLALQ